MDKYLKKKSGQAQLLGGYGYVGPELPPLLVPDEVAIPYSENPDYEILAELPAEMVLPEMSDKPKKSKKMEVKDNG